MIEHWWQINVKLATCAILAREKSGPLLRGVAAVRLIQLQLGARLQLNDLEPRSDLIGRLLAPFSL